MKLHHQPTAPEEAWDFQGGRSLGDFPGESVTEAPREKEVGVFMSNIVYNMATCSTQKQKQGALEGCVGGKWGTKKVLCSELSLGLGWTPGQVGNFFYCCVVCEVLSQPTPSNT